jgi:hypothetical protein
MIRAIAGVIVLIVVLIVIPMMLSYSVVPFHDREQMKKDAVLRRFTDGEIVQYLAEARRVEAHWADFKGGQRRDLLPLMTLHVAIQDLGRVPAQHEQYRMVKAAIDRLAAIQGPVAQAWGPEGARLAEQAAEEGRRHDSEILK